MSLLAKLVSQCYTVFLFKRPNQAHLFKKETNPRPTIKRKAARLLSKKFIMPIYSLRSLFIPLCEVSALGKDLKVIMLSSSSIFMKIMVAKNLNFLS